jgi:cell fate regulator YaaT (PSP1 superfamily)
MAKEQNLSLNPSKISGICGRLMCCLSYEYQTYEELKKILPRLGTKVKTPKGPGVVKQVKILEQKAVVELESGREAEFRSDEVQVSH